MCTRIFDELNSFVTEGRSNEIGGVAAIDLPNIVRNPLAEYKKILSRFDILSDTEILNESVISVSGLSAQELRCLGPRNTLSSSCIIVSCIFLSHLLLFISGGLEASTVGPIPRWVRLSIAQLLCALMGKI